MELAFKKIFSGFVNATKSALYGIINKNSNLILIFMECHLSFVVGFFVG
jgi:hypothetical protein